MSGVRIEFSDAAWGQFMRDNLSGLTAEVGEKIAQKVRGKVPESVPVTVQHGQNKSGRPVAMVTVAHPSGLARQAKNGILTRSVAEVGIDSQRYQS